MRQWIFVSLALFAGCSSSNDGSASGKALPAGSVGLNDVSVLLPLPKTSQETDLLIKPADVGVKGQMLPDWVAPGPALVQSEDRGDTLKKLRVVATRLDPCWPSIAVADMTKCQRVLHADAAVHTFHRFTSSPSPPVLGPPAGDEVQMLRHRDLLDGLRTTADEPVGTHEIGTLPPGAVRDGERARTVYEHIHSGALSRVQPIHDMREHDVGVDRKRAVPRDPTCVLDDLSDTLGRRVAGEKQEPVDERRTVVGPDSEQTPRWGARLGKRHDAVDVDGPPDDGARYRA